MGFANSHFGYQFGIETNMAGGTYPGFQIDDFWSGPSTVT